MKRRTFDDSGDAGNVVPIRSPLMCEANGCPNRWSVSREGSRGLCSAHAWADKHAWPRITQEQLDAETDRARANAEPKQQAPHVSLAQKRAILERLRRIDFAKHGQGGKAWAHALKARDDAGERLTIAQRDAYRAALASERHTGTEDDA